MKKKFFSSTFKESRYDNFLVETSFLKIKPSTVHARGRRQLGGEIAKAAIVGEFWFSVQIL